MHSLNNRLSRLEQALKDRQQAQVSQSDAELREAAIAKYEAMPDEQLLAEYEAWKTAPFDATADPVLAVKLAEINAIDDPNELIKLYMQNL